MLEEIGQLKEVALRELSCVADLAGLESWRISYLGKRGALIQLVRRVGSLPPEQRPLAGQAANEAKLALESAWGKKQRELQEKSLAQALEAERIDATLPGRQPLLGQVHPVTQVLREITDIFVAMGFRVVEGPEVEWDRYNFEMLNIPADHPARDMWDTFYISGRVGEMLLRTHTSPNQVRIMEKNQPPIRVIVPGKCYRYEAVDATHEAMFYQVEGLAVDEGITMGDLKGVLTIFAKAMYGKERKVRFRCDYFPFVEPGVEMSVECYACKGSGCRICKNTGWLELMGAGMVHPRVLEGVGYDSTRYTGFAFGMGPERIAMQKYGIEDLRYFYANDLRFLRQFR